MDDAETVSFEARTHRMRVLLSFLRHEPGPDAEADEELKSAFNLAVEAAYHTIRHLALETCTSCRPSSLNDLSKDSVTNPSQAALAGRKPDG